MISPCHTSVNYTSPAHGGWGIVRVGMLVPESHQLFVCPFACGRHGAIGAISHNIKDRLSYLYIDEADIVSGGYEDLIVEAAGELLEALDNRPRVLMIFVSCLDDLLGTDHDALLAQLRERYAPTRFAVGHMNPLSRDSEFPPAVNILCTNFGLLEPTKQRYPAVNLWGNHVAVHPDCELHTLLAEGGIAVKEISRCTDFAGFQEMAGSALTIAVRPTAVKAAQQAKARLGLDYLSLPVTYDMDEVDEQYRQIREKLLPNAAWDLLPHRARTEEAIRRALKRVGDRPIAIDDSATCRPFTLARVLVQSGFQVRDVFTQACPEMEKASLEWLRANTSVRLSDPTAPTTPVTRRVDPEVICVGFECGYFFSASHGVDLADDETLYGFHGIRLLMERLGDAAENTVDMKKMIEEYGLVV